jgi:hypothetical protein
MVRQSIVIVLLCILVGSLPGNATPGTYTVISRITINYGSAQSDGSFTVR